MPTKRRKSNSPYARAVRRGVARGRQDVEKKPEPPQAVSGDMTSMDQGTAPIISVPSEKLMGSLIGRFHSTDKPDLIIDADSAVEKVNETQNEIQEKMEKLQIAIEQQKKNVDNLQGMRDLVKEHLKQNPTNDRSGSDSDVVHSKEIEELNHKLEERQNELDEEKKTFVSEKRKCQEEIDNLKKEKYRLHQNNEQLLEKYRSLQREVQRKDSENRQLQNDNQQLKKENKTILETIQILERKLSSAEENVRLARQKKVCVSLYSGNQTTLMEASIELTKMLCFHWEALGIQAKVEPCLDPKLHTGTTPLIILCINASRLGTDVSNATQNIHCDQSVAVVILHHKEYHALPSQASEKLLVGAQYRQLGAIVDIAFLKSKGLYPCDMNEKALDKLTSFIHNFIKQGAEI